jgi:pyruvate kinase
MKKFILTVGPSLLHKVPISTIHKDKYIYRINGAHGSVEDIENYVLKIRQQVPSADVLMDLPGNKVRTKNITTPIKLVKGEEFDIPCSNFNFTDFYKHLEVGMTAWANDSVFEFEVKKVTEKSITFLSKSDGLLLDNKGVHIRGIHDHIPFLFEKDKQLIELANKHNISYVGLSFVRKAEDVKQAKSLIKNGINIISKIETIDAVNNINDILKLVEFILVDRGDLSTDIGIEKIPRFQKFIIEKALYNNVNVFLATQVLKNMEEKPIPTIAEIDDLYNIYKSGVYGVQMSEETAVGKYIRECIDMLDRMDEEVTAEKIRM